MNVSVPYHPHKKAVVFKTSVNYDTGEQLVSAKMFVDLAGYEDEGETHNLKYSHHTSGFIQFSGAGVLSGQNSDGSPKGIGISSWPLTNPVSGPAFAVTITAIDQFESVNKTDSDDVLFDSRVLGAHDGKFRLFFGFHYFPESWRRVFDVTPDGNFDLPVTYPDGRVLRMKPLLPSSKIALKSFVAVHCYAEVLRESLPCQIIFSGSTGNIRFNKKNQKLGDGIYYMYPDQSVTAKKSLNYSPTPHSVPLSSQTC